jgi:hypothetical protein
MLKGTRVWGAVFVVAALALSGAMGCAAPPTAEDSSEPLPPRSGDEESEDDQSSKNNEPVPQPSPSPAPKQEQPKPATPAGPMKAFVSSTLHQGSKLGGVEGADAICNQLAKAASLPGTYKAWISAGNTNAIDRFTGNGPWQRMDGQIVASSKADLAKGALTISLDKDEKGQTPPAVEDRVWTATGMDGKKSGGDCNGWTGNGAGRVGEAEQAGGHWTSLVDESCGQVNRIYCFQQ